MAGKKADYSGGTNMSSLKYFGIPIVSVGLANPKEPDSYEIIIERDKDLSVYKKIVLKDNIIVGMTFVNDIERVGILFYLMKNHIKVQEFKQDLLMPDFNLASLPEAILIKMNVGVQANEQSWSKNN